MIERHLSPFPMLHRYAFLLLFAAASASAQDLSITATAEDQSGEAGGRVTLDYTVTLTGAEEIEDVSVGFYFSTNETVSDDDILSEREDVDAESDEPESDNEQIDIPESLDSGDYFILVFLDDLEQVSETDETNNVVAIPFTVTGGGTGGGGGADLSITSASAEPASAEPGDEIEVTYTLGNSGSEDARESQVAFYFSRDRNLSSNDVLAERTDADEADAGDSDDSDEDVTVPNSLEPGDYFLLVVADDRNAVTETNESNNVRAVAFTVTGDGGTGGGGTADLAITEASVSPSSGEAGDEIEVSYTLANMGGEQAGESQIGVYFSRDRSLGSSDVLAARIDADEADAGDSDDDDEDITVPASLAAGDYFILVVADDRNRVTETRENNNVEAVPFTLTSGAGGGGGDADLRITEASVEPTTVEAGMSVEVEATLANEGEEQAGASQVAFYLSRDRDLSTGDVRLGSFDADEVDAGDSGDEDQDLTIPSSTAPGDYFLLVVADDGNVVTESAENNNTFAVALAVTMTTASEPTAEAGLALLAPSPNPATGEVRVAFSLAAPAPVRLAVYDVQGREVLTLADGSRAPGTHEVRVDAQKLAPGVYVLRLATPDATQTRHLTVAR